MVIVNGRRRSGGSPKGIKNNPTGKGGFKERPQDMNTSGRWKAEDSISFQYHLLMHLSLKEFEEWLDKHPEEERTMAQQLAYNAVVAAKVDFKYLVEVTDRTEGKAPQSITHDGELKNIFEDEQIDRIAERIAGRKRKSGDTSGS